MKDFAAIDFETANGHRSSICSVGVVIVRGGQVADRFYSLIYPYPEFLGSPAKACGNRNTIKLQVARFNKQKAY